MYLIEYYGHPNYWVLEATSPKEKSFITTEMFLTDDTHFLIFKEDIF